MNILKNIVFVVLGLVALALIIALFIDGDFSFEQTVKIEAPIEKVWEHTSTLVDLNSWSPWVAKDRSTKHDISGTDGTVGAEACWDREYEDVGKSCQKITKIDAPNLFETNLSFERPQKSAVDGVVKLKAVDGGTEVTRGFSSTLPYPFRIMKLVMNLEKEVGEEFTQGMNTLKALSES